MKHLIAAAILAFAATGATAEDIVKVPASGGVAQTMDALVSAVEGAGATVFARVDHAGGAEGAGMDLAPAQVLVFGNPQLGTPVMQADPLAGLYLPMRVLVYEDAEGKVWLAYQEPDEMFDDLDVADDMEVIGKMAGALKSLTGAAAGG